MVSSNSDPLPIQVGSSGDTLREAFGYALCELANVRNDFVVFDADIAGGTGTHHFRRMFPGRFFQFGIAEQNMMAAAGGFSAIGFSVFVTTFAVFALRALEQARLSVAYPMRNVKIVASHPGLDVGPDGASAQCLEDLAVFRAIPNMVVVSPADQLEVRQATQAILDHRGPVYMRTGRSPSRRIFGSDHQFFLGKGQVLLDGTDVTFVACGVEVIEALDAAVLLRKDGIAARVVNMPTLKPIDDELLTRCARETGCIVTAEDHNIYGGLGSAVAEVIVKTHPCPMEFVGVSDVFGESGEPNQLKEKYGLTASYLVEAVRKVLSRKRSER